MKIVPGGSVSSALLSTSLAVMMCVAGTAYAQSGNTVGEGGANSAQYGAGNNGGSTTGSGTGTSLTQGVGTAGRPATGNITGGVPSAPALNNMRANGTSLNMSPDPRAPNVTGRAAPPR